MMKEKKSKTRELNRIALAGAFLVVCSWLTVPGIVPFTMQSFAVFVVSALLGGRCGFYTVLIYILLGIIGLPVFAGMRGGVGVLFSETGGYLAGFLVGAPVCGIICQKFKSITATVAAMLLCLLICYVLGCVWIWSLYFNRGETQNLITILNSFVLPFLIPDIVKIVLAVSMVRILRKTKIDC